MEDQQHDSGTLEMDSAEDFSLITSRLESFRGSNLVQLVPAERLARAGFHYIGPSDRVRCFSCHKTVENWCTGDRPVERHKEVSPFCKFLSCIYRTSSTSLTNGSAYNEEAEDMEYRLRTGQVVDESIYPVVPHMRSEESRLHTFSTWPLTAPVSPCDLAQAGLYYLGQCDQVQCFCCGGTLADWEIGDSAWAEHSKHFPFCFFILGHDVGNIPFQGSIEEEGSGRLHTSASVHMGTFEERLRSFAGVNHPLNIERLARAGFYSNGTEDMVLCFCCNGGLKGWQPEEDPWEQHARHYPGCRFLLAEKGQEFVNRIQLQMPQQNKASSDQNGFLAARNDDDPLEKLQKLQREKLCKICMDKDIDIVFIPCGHLVTCNECSVSLIKCPICCGDIRQKVKTYIT
ncbi:E3 ubiquitin-protein ligase XIAP [Takifugu flavidus]|uniref:E3 ubiquitin-protein ligase XIAP n=1 Tax=Takifugu flavidus TaxID=433684 RepID=A0A5C6MK59_9TELE|nr:E3 ubiquitin-protein ligase XIAP [Takifugu flavidus]TWW55203.1 E3 ubiquitin-protein ligase XIAP [Takifugu flavidus]